MRFWGKLPVEWRGEVAEYLRGERKIITVKPEIAGTEFQRKVLKEIEKIPYGEVRTYGEIAVAAGFPGAARAVGSACASNRNLIVVPCHRVVSRNGIGGYRFGIEVKRELLRVEGIYY